MQTPQTSEVLQVRVVSCNINLVEDTVALKQDFQDLFTSISVVAAVLPIMERPNATLKSDFVNI